jgi:alpha-amylase
MIYQGQEQGFTGAGVPDNREALWSSSFSTTHPLYTFTALMNAVRHHAIAVDATGYLSYQSHVIYSDNSTIAFRKGAEGRQVVSVLSTAGEQMGEYTLDLPTAYTPGSPVTDVVACRNYTVNDYGQLTLAMGGGVPKVLFPSAKLNGSRLCGFGDVSLEIMMEGGAASGLRGLSLALVVTLAAAVGLMGLATL